MKLDFLWIKDFKNIKKQGFNFGSFYNYVVEEVTEFNGLILKREINHDYIPHFFKVEGKGLDNISAIVGENASGKSNLISFIREILAGQVSSYELETDKWIYHQEFIAVFTNSFNQSGHSYLWHQLYDNNLEIEFNPKNYLEFHKNTQCIYYSPIYDFNIFPITDSASHGIDVSSNFLLYKDFENKEESFSNISQADFHKFQNTGRQLRFIHDFQDLIDIQDSIYIPNEAKVVVKQNKYRRTSNEGLYFHHTPYNFRPFLNLLLHKFDEEINTRKESDELNEAQEISFLRERFMLNFNFYFFINIYNALETNGDFLDTGRVFCNTEELSNLTFKDAFELFISRQNIIKKRPTLGLISSINSLRDSFYNFDIYSQDEVSANISIEKLDNLRLTYIEYLDKLQLLYKRGIISEFINFDWKGLSTGEKSFLDLFSRIYHAKIIIDNKLEEQNKNYTTKIAFPDYIYLLLDEAELGFHLQWQKEYIYNLINFIPYLFRNNDTKIQLIFTTHSPLSLSDIPQSNAIFLSKEKRNSKVLNRNLKPKHSFGANIHEMLYDAFYLKDGFIGNFAHHKIQKAIDWCLAQDNRKHNTEVYNIIKIIDDPIVKVKLSEMYAHKGGKSIEAARLRAQRDYINKRLNELNNND